MFTLFLFFLTTSINNYTNKNHFDTNQNNIMFIFL